jgi:hypothetical protein
VDGTRQEDHFLEGLCLLFDGFFDCFRKFVTKTRSEQVRRTQGGPQSRFPGYVMSSSVRERSARGDWFHLCISKNPSLSPTAEPAAIVKIAFL